MNLRRGDKSKQGVTPADVAGVAVVVVLTLAFVFGLVMPLGTRERVHAARVQAIAQQKRRAAELASQVRVANERLKALQTRINASPLQIRTPDAINERLAGVVRLADECGLGVRDLKPGDGVRVRRYVVLPVRLSGNGTYPDAAEFLRKLHTQLPDVGVRSMKLNSVAGSAACEFELSWFACPPVTAKSGAMTAVVP